MEDVNSSPCMNLTVQHLKQSCHNSRVSYAQYLSYSYGSQSFILNTPHLLREEINKDSEKIKKEQGYIMMEDSKEELLNSINYLPDEVLIEILSMVSIDDAVRSSILSKRWRFLWRQTSHLDFNVEHMLQPLTRLSIPPEAQSNFILEQNTREGLLKYSMLFLSILEKHLGNLTSCRFLHFLNLDLESLIPVLFEKKKGLKNLTIACEPLHTLQSFPNSSDVWNSFSSLSSLELSCYFLENPSTFEGCKNLKTLKLKDLHVKDETINELLKSCVSLENFTLFNTFGFRKLQIRNPNLKFLELNFLLTNHIQVFTESLEVLVLVSITCLAKNLVIVAPNIREFHCFSNRKISVQYPAEVKTQELLLHCSGLLDPTKGNIFKNLSFLSVDLDLNSFKEALLLSHILRSSVDLQTLKVIIPVFNIARRMIPSFVAGDSRYPSTFWERREICNCVHHKLRFVYIEGFSGKELEVDFIKYLIMRSTKLKMITIVCHNSVEDANELLLLNCASANLSIKLKAAEGDSCNSALPN